MVNVFIAYVIGFCIFMISAILFAWWWNNRTYKNYTSIARQTGRSVDDVIWIRDRFRVKHQSGMWVIQFKNLREKTTSVSGEFWTKFFAPKYYTKVLSFTEEQWKGLDLSRLIRRGIMFYETSEGEFHPMVIKFDGEKAELHVITQDNRQFLINEVKDINSLTKNRFKEMLLLGGIILACFILAVIFVIGIIYLKESAQTSLANSQQACIEYYRVVQNISTTANTAGGAQFLDQLTGVLVSS